MSENGRPPIDSDALRTLRELRREQVPGSRERLLYECAETIVANIARAHADEPVLDDPDEIPVRRYPLRLVK